MSDDITIAIPTFEGDPALLYEVFRRAQAQAARPIIVVDMSRTDVVARVAERFAGEVARIPLPDSRGVSHSRNVCIEHAATRYVLFLDSDALVEPGWLEGARRGFDRPQVAVVGSRVLADWPGRRPWLFDTVTAADWLSLFDLGLASREVPRVMGTSYALDRARLGDAPFDERLGRSPGQRLAHEEVQLALDARSAGWRCWYAADSVVRHRFDRSRLSWRFMMGRAYTAGREAALLHPDHGLDPLPRPPLGVRDRAFRLAVGPAFLAGQARSRIG